MMAGTKRFTFFQILVGVFLIIWIGSLLKISQFNFHILISQPILIAGILLIFVQLIMLGIRKKTIRDLKTSEFKDITWLKIFATFCLAVILSLMIEAAIKSISTLKTNFSNVTTQIIGGFVSGMVGFVSAMFVYNYQQRNKQEEEAKELTESLWYEILHNMLIIKGDLDRQLPFFRRLETNCWNAAISSKLSIKGNVKGFILNFYGNVDFYNDVYQTQKGLLLQEETINKSLGGKLIQLRENFAPSLYEEAKKANAILFGEMVRLGYRQKKDWSYSDIDWERLFSEFSNKI